MASSSGFSLAPSKIVTFLQTLGVKEEVVERFRTEEIDEAAVELMSDVQLKEFGLIALGHQLKLRNFCKNKSRSTNEGTSNEREENLEKLRKLIGNSAQSRKGKTPLQRDGPNPKKQRMKETLRFEFGWKHWIDGKFVQKKMTQGGGNRSWDVPRDATLNNCIDIAKSLFFPMGKNAEGEASDMAFTMGNFSGEILGDLEEGGEVRTFTAARYKTVTGLNRPRLYLLSKSLLSSDDENDDELAHSPFGNPKSSSSPLNLESPVFNSDFEGVDDDVLSHTLMGSSEERQQFFDELEQQVRESEWLDREKEKRKEQEKKLTKEKAAEAIRTAKEEAEELENLRMRRESRVPPEPTDSDECVTIRVRHQVLGIVERRFTKDSCMNTAYDWIGSLNLTPKFFSISLWPDKQIYPDENVTLFSGTVLCMNEIDAPLPLSEDEKDVSFFSGIDDAQFNETVVDSNASLGDDSSVLAISVEPPNVLLSGDEPDTATGKNSSTDSYPELEAKRKMESEKLLLPLHVVISRHEIVAELLKLYQDDDILTKKLFPSFEEEEATGDGVLREMYSLFWQNFARENCRGSSQFSFTLLPQITDHYVAVGRIITHQFLQCGSFPVNLARASVHYMLFGKVEEDCLVDSFLHLLPPKQRDIFNGALQGGQPFPVDEVIDVLDDYNVKTLPTAANLRAVTLATATNELVEKPFLALLKIKQGMGTFWDDVSPQMIDDIYSLYNLTACSLIDHLHCVPLNTQEGKVLKWLKLYLREAESGTLTKFLQFCTASQVLLPDKKISVRMVTMSEMAMRPRARTCFGILEIPRNFLSFNQLKENFDLYINHSALWDLND